MDKFLDWCSVCGNQIVRQIRLNKFYGRDVWLHSEIKEEGWNHEPTPKGNRFLKKEGDNDRKES